MVARHFHDTKQEGVFLSIEEKKSHPPLQPHELQPIWELRKLSELYIRSFLLFLILIASEISPCHFSGNTLIPYTPASVLLVIFLSVRVYSCRSIPRTHHSIASSSSSTLIDVSEKPGILNFCSNRFIHPAQYVFILLITY